MIGLVRYGQRHGVELRVNWLGRWGVWPVMSALFFAMAGVEWLAHASLYLGLALGSRRPRSTFATCAVSSAPWPRRNPHPELEHRYACGSVTQERTAFS